MPRRPSRPGPARQGAHRKDAKSRAGRGQRSEALPAQRIQKLLSAAGVGSRREVERWIREGRLQVNGEVPALGAKLEARDRITLDGRPVRLHADKGKEARVLLFHRSPGDALDLKAATSRAAELLNLPRSSGRWLAIQPMPPVDGGLEILTDDGSWAHRISQGAHALTVDYVLRMRGPLTPPLIEEFRAATDCEGDPMSIVKAEAQIGEGFNHWLNVTVRATRSAQVRHWWAARGIIVSRLMRVRFGPVHLSRELPRGHSRAMLPSERNALVNEIDAAKAEFKAAAENPGAASSIAPTGPASYESRVRGSGPTPEAGRIGRSGPV
jgi:23S rRNA pseudouridine2605 synthase